MLGASSEGARTAAPRRGHRGDRPRLARSARSATRSPTATPRRCSPGSTRLAGEYERAGIAAWTVWVPELRRGGDRGARSAPATSSTASRWRCRSSSSGCGPAELGDLDWDVERRPGRARARSTSSPTARRRRRDGPGADDAAGRGGDSTGARPTASSPACWRRWITSDDLGIYFVATHPEHRGRGLATPADDRGAARGPRARPAHLVAAGLADGPPIYARLGYTTDFALRMYERRQAGMTTPSEERAGGGARARSASRALRRGRGAGQPRRAGAAADPRARRSRPAAGSRSRTRPGCARRSASDDPRSAARAVRMMLAEETRMGMMVGVAVGWALAEELRRQEEQ